MGVNLVDCNINLFFFQEGKLTEEQFATNLQTTLNSPPQPNLVGFLKVGVKICYMAKKVNMVQNSRVIVQNQHAFV